MSEQTLDLKKSVRIAWRHKTIVGIVAALGLLIGAGFATLHPAMLTSKTIVVLPPSTPNMATEVVVAGSDPVLQGALPSLGPGMSLSTLRTKVQVKSLTSTILSFTAHGGTAAQAEAIANDVAQSYIDYVGSSGSPVGHVSGRVLDPATSATGTSPLVHLLKAGLIGALGGVLIGVVAALAIRRKDRSLRERDQIANSIGLPVLASLPVEHPSDPAEWTKLLDNYKPAMVDAWHLRKALQSLEVPGVSVNTSNASNGGSFSLAVISLSSDHRALALGPQLAVFTASIGIPTNLLIGPQGDTDSTAALRIACAAAPSASSGRSKYLQVTVSDDGSVERQANAALTVSVLVVDGRTPRIPATLRTTATVLGVSAGAATAEQLARVAVSVAVDGREIAGILVSDPEQVDRTTGRIPQLAAPASRRMPTRLTGMTTEIRR
jgi:capsular polysaccharide biosynthesis protein